MPELPRLKHRSFDRLRNLSPRKLKLKKVFTRKRLVIAAAVVAAFLVLTPIITYAYYAHDISNRDRLMNRNNTGLVLLDRNGKPFYQYGKTSGDDDVPLSQISDNLEHAALASEDNNFYNHPGYSLKGIGAALFADLGSGDLTKYGGSTITQQLVKNKLLGSSKNFLRKYQEVAMAIAVERKYTKDEILDMYLNSVFFGEGAFGVKDAAKTYFDTTPDKLTVAQSSMLIGLLPAPSIYSPISGDAQLAKERQHYVLDQMARHHYITKEQKTAALGTKLTYAHAAESTFIHAQHYAMMVIDKLNDKYGDERVVRSGFTVTTGLDLSMQTQAEAIIKKRVAQFADQGGSNAGLVAIDPRSGEVRVLVGSVDWNNKQFGKYNMALALRQPGSSFKPIYYAEAFQKHLITPATIMHDRPTTFGDWTPVNYDGRYRGNIKVRDALATSLNIPAAEVMERVGVETAAQAAKRMGITTIHNPESYGLTLALGTAEVQLYQLTNAYAAFANGGVQHDPTLITSIKDKYGKTVYKAPRESERVQSEQASFLINSILSDNVARAPSYGSTLNVPGHQVAVKTGTTNDNRDAWTLGYTPSLAVGVWVGNNQNVPMQGLYGGNSAGRIWDEVMRSYLRNTPDEPFDVPKGIVQLYMCPGTELRTANDARSSYREYFIVGTQPQGECRVKHETKTPKKHEDNKKPDKPTKPGTTDTTPTPPPPDDGTGGGSGDGGTTTPPPPPDDGTPPPPDDGTNPPPTGT